MPNTDEGDGRRPTQYKIAVRILKGIQNTQKQITIKWIPARRVTGERKS
jgi:hypothetical protein